MKKSFDFWRAVPCAALVVLVAAPFVPAAFGQQTNPPVAPALPTDPPRLTPNNGDNLLPPASVAPVALPARPASLSNPVLREATNALRDGDSEKAARLLKPVNVSTLTPNDARRWRGLASLAALRTGDRVWLDRITSDPEYFANSMNLITITAQRFLQDGQYDQARALLLQVKNAERLDEIPRRRYLQLWARLEQLSSNRKAERVYLAKLVSFAGRWPSATCQGCHANPKKFGEETTTLDVSDWWVGKRFAEVLHQDGDAQNVRVRAQAALVQNPADDAARLRLGYALRAEGKAQEAEAVLRGLSWAEFPDRPAKTPLRLATFP